MNMCEIQEKIDHCCRCIDDCNDRIKELDYEREKLIAYRSDLDTFIKKISEDIEQRKIKLNTLSQDNISSNILGRYCDGMYSMLTDTRFKENFYNLELNLERTNQNISDIEDQLLRLSAQRDDALSDMAYWESQMPYADDYSA